jgi:hypothetical protein
MLRNLERTEQTSAFGEKRDTVIMSAFDVGMQMVNNIDRVFSGALNVFLDLDALVEASNRTGYGADTRQAAVSTVLHDPRFRRTLPIVPDRRRDAEGGVKNVLRV